MREAGFAFFILVAAFLFRSPAFASETSEPVRTIGSFWDKARANELRDIDLEVVLTYYDPAWGNAWAVGSDRSGYLPFPRGLNLKAHDRIRITGQFVCSRGLSKDQIHISVVESNVSLQPLDANGKIGQFDSFVDRLVTFDAIVNGEDLTEQSHVQMRLIADGFRVNLYYWTPHPESFNLPVGTTVRVTGVYNPLHESRSESVEIDLWLSDRKDLSTLGTLATDARFDLPASPIESLNDLYYTGVTSVKVAGTVQSLIQGVGFTLRDKTGEVLVQSLQLGVAEIGKPVEAVGHPFTGGADWVLRKAIARQAPAPQTESPQPSPEDSGAPIRVAAQVISLSNEEARKSHPVNIMGVIMRPRPNTGFIFLKDTSGTIRVEMGALDTPFIKTGMRIAIHGTTAAGTFVPHVIAEKVTLWGSALLPAPKPITLDQASTGDEEGRRVELRGYVSNVSVGPQFSRIQVATPSGDFVAVTASEHDWKPLVGCVVSIRGVCQAVANKEGQLESVELFTSEKDDLLIEQQALRDPFSIPLSTISALRLFEPNNKTNFWHRVRGIVTHAVAGKYVVIQDENAGLMVLTKQMDHVSPGDQIEATGFRGSEGRQVVLREATFRKTGSGNQPAPELLNAASQLNESLEHRLIQVEGHLLNVVQKADTQLLLEAGDTTFRAVLASTGSSNDETRLLPGSKLKLTGVYEVLRDELRHPREFRVLLRSNDDISVSEYPSWWTPQRALMATCIFCIGGIAASSWLILLRRRVKRQTDLIRTQLVKEAHLEARHRGIFEKANDFIFTTDSSGRLTSFNPAGETLTGFSREEALQMNVRDLFPAGIADKNLMSVITEGSDSTTSTSQLRRKDGSLTWVETSARRIQQEKESAGLLGLVRDVNARKQLEQELTRARDAAETNTQLKSTFLANMSHEIRTPMNGVIGMSNILLDTSLDREQRDFAETIRNSAESLLRVLNDILDFSKVEAGKLQFEEEPFKLFDVIDGTLDLLAPRVVGTGVEIAAFVEPSTPRYFKGDPGRIRQVLLNLLGNSIKFTSKGEVVLSVKVLESAGGLETLQFDITDTGIGMDRATAQRLFQPFVQADASTTRRFGGTGLGLAIAKQIVELMGGSIGVESEQGKGSTFRFVIKLPRCEAPVTSNPPMPAEALKGLRVLAVDDLLINQRIISYHCASWGMRCTVANSADTAMDLLLKGVHEGDPYRLVISDYQMPEKDGVALASAIRADSRISSVPFILFTSIDKRLPPALADQLRISSVILKPIRIAELLSAVRVAAGIVATDGPVARNTPSADASGETLSTDLRILVAEDNRVNQRVISIQLKALGFEVDIVANGNEVLTALEKSEYDVILMDCQMPELDGFEATKRIRTIRAYDDIRIIALTAGAMESDREKCRLAGMDDYLTKPTRKGDMTAALAKVKPRGTTASS